jgi:hypothetical protein
MLLKLDRWSSERRRRDQHGPETVVASKAPTASEIAAEVVRATPQRFPAAPPRSTPEQRLSLTFKLSPLFTTIRKARISSQFEAFYEYILKIRFPVSATVPPIGISPGSGISGTFVRPGPIYLESLMIPEKSIDDAATLRRAYALYAFQELFSPRDAPVLKYPFEYAVRASWIFTEYFTASFTGDVSTNSLQGTSDIDNWTGALWEVRRECGKEFADQMLLYAFKSFSEGESASTFSEFFYGRLMLGESVVDNNFQKLPVIAGVLSKRGLRQLSPRR